MSEVSIATLIGIRSAADVIQASKKVTVLTGAGVSTASGIPDFRSTDNGLWERYDPFEVASLTAFRYYPEKFFEWMRSLASNIHNAQPNAAHWGIARLQQAGLVDTVVTQNIDNLHQKAGSTNILEVHGSLETMTCVSCYYQTLARPYLDAYLERAEIPQCPKCRNILKPDVILFGEQLPVRTWLKAQDASRTCDLMIVAGSSLEVLPVASLPMRAIENGAHLIIINQSRTYIDVRADFVFNNDVISIIPRLVREVLGD